MTLDINYLAPDVQELIAAATQAEASQSPPTDTSAKALEADILKGRKAIARLLKGKPEELKSKAFVMDCLRQFGLCSTYWPVDGDFDVALNVSEFGAIQYPSEFVDFLLLAGATNPTKIAEVGVAHGCSSYFAAAYFTALNPKTEYTLIDISDRLIDFDYYAGILKLKKEVPNTAAGLNGTAYDVVFIDADHTYRGARLDYLALGQHAKLCAFHDINATATAFEAQEGGISQFWKELKEAKRETHCIVEISHSRKGNWMGIGVIYKG
jgi:hypothetical protein